MHQEALYLKTHTGNKMSSGTVFKTLELSFTGVFEPCLTLNMTLTLVIHDALNHLVYLWFFSCSQVKGEYKF